VAGVFPRCDIGLGLPDALQINRPNVGFRGNSAQNDYYYGERRRLVLPQTFYRPMGEADHDTQTLSQQDFIHLFVEHEPRLYGYIRALVPNQADAENVLQETSAVLWENFGQFQPGTDFARWAITVARYQVMYFRQQQRRNVLSFSQPFVDVIAEAAADATEGLGNTQRALDECLRELKDADLDLFRRRYQPGAKVPAIAAELGRPVTTVYHALDRIRRALLDCTERRLRREGG
jgi:RNA polymerase sigma-70 factor (ECF subfamily)